MGGSGRPISELQLKIDIEGPAFYKMSQENAEEHYLKNENAIEHSSSDEKEQKNSEEDQFNYYSEFCRLYLTNTILTAQLKELSIEKNDLIGKLTRIEKRAEELSEGNSGQLDEKKRRVRRSASEIARHYKCQVEGCSKSYGSEGSLNQHLKIKHPDIFRSLSNYLSGAHIVKESDEEDDSM